MMYAHLPQRLMGGVHNTLGLQHQPLYQLGFPLYRFADPNRGSLLGYNAGEIINRVDDLASLDFQRGALPRLAATL